MKPRIVFVHGNSATHWSFGWAPWFKQEVEKQGFSTFFETMPDSVIARSQYWLPFLKDHVGVGERDILVGWSSGAVAVMRYAEANKIQGSVLISPCYTDLGDDMEKQSGYYDTPWQWDKIKANQGKIALFWGDDDPFIPQTEFEFIAEQLDPTRICVPGGGHFAQDTFPQLLQYIQENY
jgi:predicted alpha/beta hydrolase family esterase